MSNDPRALPVPDGWAIAIEGWKGAMRAADLSPRTIKTRAEQLAQLARALEAEPGEVTRERLIEWAGSKAWAAETRRSRYAAYRSFFAWCTVKGVCASSPAAGLPKVKAAPPCPRPAPELAVHIARTEADERVQLMVRLGDEAGLRRGEIAQVHEDDLIPDLDGWTLVVHGKGRKDRLVPLPDALARMVRTACERGGGFAFPGRIEGHLSPRRVGELLRDVLPGAHTAHSLRHRFATRTLKASGGNLAVVQDLLGHASPATTRRYIPKDLSAMRAAVEAIGA